MIFCDLASIYVNHFFLLLCHVDTWFPASYILTFISCQSWATHEHHFRNSAGEVCRNTMEDSATKTMWCILVSGGRGHPSPIVSFATHCTVSQTAEQSWGISKKHPMGLIMVSGLALFLPPHPWPPGCPPMMWTNGEQQNNNLGLALK